MIMISIVSHAASSSIRPHVHAPTHAALLDERVQSRSNARAKRDEQQGSERVSMNSPFSLVRLIEQVRPFRRRP